MKHIETKRATLTVALSAVMGLNLLCTPLPGSGQDLPYKYNIRVQVDYHDYCSPYWRVDWVCAIGYDLQGSCQGPDANGQGEVVGICINRQQKNENDATCDKRREAADRDCSPGRAIFYCSTDNPDVSGYECDYSE
jgi:hypothetical protein